MKEMGRRSNWAKTNEIIQQLDNNIFFIFIVLYAINFCKEYNK